MNTCEKDDEILHDIFLMFYILLMAPIRLHLLLFNNINMNDSTILKFYLSKVHMWVFWQESLFQFNSNHENSSKSCFQLLLDCIDFEWELYSHGYELPCVFAAICWKIRSRSLRLKSNKSKTRENIFLYFLPQSGIKPKIFQSLVLP